jgi:Flp pilus assembly protein TadG
MNAPPRPDSPRRRRSGTLRGLRPGARRDDEGQISLLVLVLTVAVLAMIGLSVDGGGRIRALQRADNLAAEAARAAGQALQAPQAIQGGPKVIDPDAAVTAAHAYLAAAGVTGTVTVWPDRRHVTITVTIAYQTRFLALVGIDTLTATRHATAVLVAT